MNTPSSNQAVNWREGRRLRAWELYQQGWKQCRIAAALGVSQGAVSQWCQRARTAGPQALLHHPPPGAAARLSCAQQTQLGTLLDQPPSRFGFRGEVWTTKRVAQLIKDQFGVRYHRAHISRLLRRLGFSVQKPRLRASQRDEAAIRRWRTQRWPTLKKKPARSSGASSG